jgi:hypothetical protein
MGRTATVRLKKKTVKLRKQARRALQEAGGPPSSAPSSRFPYSASCWPSLLVHEHGLVPTSAPQSKVCKVGFGDRRKEINN